MNIQYGQDVSALKRVYYTGSDTLREGYCLCYDLDTTTVDAATLASDARGFYVEKPASGNVGAFAGVVAASADGVTGPAYIEIVDISDRQMCANVWTEENCTINTTYLSVKAGSYAAGSSIEGPIIGLALQTVDRSSTNGLVQARLAYGSAYPDVVSLTSAAVTVTAVTQALSTSVGLLKLTVGSGVAGVATLAAGVAGQRVLLACVANGGSGATITVTPASLIGGTTIAFNAVGDTVMLRSDGTSWYIEGGNSYSVS
ncbi:MAG: hypothetical protein M0R06_19695 [Sphaerochaeta sp.]|jgi:hypothetical protein|nr:hypothetical protein [Sphaerochaeta sp.]